MESSGNQEVGSSVDESPRSEGAESDTLKKTQGNAADTSVDSGVEEPTCTADSMTQFMCNHESREVSSTSYIHPFILKRMMQVPSMLSKEKNTADDSVGSIDKGISCIEASDGLKLEQLVKARVTGILEYSPEDEVEGELIYYQHKLVQLAVSSKHCCADLMFRVVKNLPEEMDAVGDQKWDDVLVYQYLCELREAKKQGRKEKRYKEAQAVLAAATAAAAASSRISSFRKDGHDESGQHEVNTISGRTRPHSHLLPRPKETLSRLDTSRASSEHQSNIFQLTSDFSKDNPRSCDVCRRSETMSKPVLVCSNCKVGVHLGCYRNVKDPVGPWYCELCEELLASRSPRAIPPNSRENPCFVVHCGLCAGSTGAFRKAANGQWIHAFCAEWMLESTFRKGQVNAVQGMGTIMKERDVCLICHRRVGVCLKCNYGNCQRTFHPFCARNAGLYLHVKISGSKVQHKGYCDRHSVEQKEKAETQQHHGAEELKSIKQIRVELEKLRLLCERIIRREKLKRELVVCSQDILVSKRDAVAVSVLVNSPFFPPDVSSGSATTSLKEHDEHKSFSEAFQRSDDISVDSKLSERPSFYGKQLPQRPLSFSSRNLTDDVERKWKLRKQTEYFPKELIMTSGQASVQNQRLPKGFVYVPTGCLSEENLVACDMGSHEQLEHDDG